MGSSFKTYFKGFSHIRSCDPDSANKFPSPCPMETFDKDVSGFPIMAAALCQRVILSTKDTSETGRIRTQSTPQTSKGKTDKHILTNNRITNDKPN